MLQLTSVIKLHSNVSTPHLFSQSPSRISRFPASPLQSTLTQVCQKHATLSPLDSALTQNRGRGGGTARLYSFCPENPLLEVAKVSFSSSSALFPIVNPIGGSPVFLSLTGDYTAPARRLLAWRITLNSFILIVASYSCWHAHPRPSSASPFRSCRSVAASSSSPTAWAMLTPKRSRRARPNSKKYEPPPTFFAALLLPAHVAAYGRAPGSISAAIHARRLCAASILAEIFSQSTGCDHRRRRSSSRYNLCFVTVSPTASQPSSAPPA